MKRNTFISLALALVATALLLGAKDEKRAAASTASKSASEQPASRSRIIAYYFHVTARCNTCRTIEAYSHDTVFNRFKSDLDGGRLEWRVVNVQLPENKHFVQDYQLFTKSLVLVHMADGKQQSYKVLNDVWELVGEKPKFEDYVYRETRDYLAKLR